MGPLYDYGKFMDIILLSGEPNSGKTTTMNLVYDELIRKGARTVEPRVQIGGKEEDFECLIDHGGNLIAIFSMGDYLYECCSAVIKYAHCDKLILAYSNKFAHNLAAVLESCPNHKVVIKSYLRQSNEKSRDSANARDAAAVISYI